MQILRPTLLLDKNKCIKNIEQMVKKAGKYKLAFRPHFKTHRSAEIANWYKKYGVDKCTVSSVEMAKYFAANGWNDITIAFPVNILEINTINEIAYEINLNLLVESSEVIDFLGENLKSNIGIFVKIDTGYHRTGVDVNNIELVKSLVNLINTKDKLSFNGFLTHSGNTYQSKSTDEILEIHEKSRLQLLNLKLKLNLKVNALISIGDTPLCSLSDSFEGVDEIRPGNFVFYDVMQSYIGSCTLDQIAVCVACPVVSKNKERNEVVIYGGSVHLSKESFKTEDKIIYGIVVEVFEDSWKPIKGSYVKSLSQEHGILHIPEEYFNSFNIGSVIGILPVHSCLTVGLMQKYKILQTGEIITTHPDNN